MQQLLFQIPPQRIIARPFVKWAGGKSRLLSEIEKVLPTHLKEGFESVYIEPFVGGGAMLFWILQKYPNIKRAVINDINSDLINVYRIVKTQPRELLGCLRRIEHEYIALDEDARKRYYLKQRNAFNRHHHTEVDAAAIFIFLNRTCFNGLYRVNSKGDFNVPHGRYANPTICDERNILAVSQLLQRVDIMCGDFEQTLKYATDNSVFYCDPPYKPLSATSSFNSYAKDKFDDLSQLRLRNFCTAITERGGEFIVSNSDVRNCTGEDTEFFDRIYKSFTIQRVYASRAINSAADKRGKISELLISSTGKESYHETQVQ